MNNLILRILSGLLGAAIILSCMYWNKFSFLAALAIINFFTLLEFYSIIRRNAMAALKIWGTLAGMFLLALTFLIETAVLTFHYYLLIFPVMLITYLIKIYSWKEKMPFTSIAYTWLGVFYISMPFAMLTILTIDGENYMGHIAASLFFLHWANDSGAFFTGKSIGKRQLFPEISPAKTWEGFFGGLIMTMGVSYLLFTIYQTYPVWVWLIIGVLVSVLGTLGDLTESMLKRSLKVKDSGNIIPGHGGFLDRFDSMLLSIPFIVVFLKLLEVLNV